MATSIKLKGDIKKIEAAIKSKATPKTLVPKLEAQLGKLKSDLASLSSAKPKKGVTKTKVLSSLQKLKSKIKTTKSLSGYKKSGIDIKKDADVPALPLGRRTAKTTGNTYYEYRLNRADVKQPPKRYPKLEEGGETSDSKIRFDMYGYIHANDHKQDGDEIIRVSSYNEAEEKAEKYLKENKYELVELYRKDDFVGSIRTKKNFAYSSRYKKEDFADGGETKVPRERMYNFLKEDLAELENDIRENNKEGIERFFSYWNVHLKSLNPADGEMMADGGETKMEEDEPKVIRGYSDDEAYEYAQGGMLKHGLMIGDEIIGYSGDVVQVQNKGNFFVVNLQEGKREMLDKYRMDKYAQGGRTTSAINRDRAYKSNQPWEQSYSRKSRPKNPKYKSSSDFFEGGGEMHRLFEEGEA